MNPFIGSLIGAAVRWLVTAAAAREIALSSDQATQIVSGGVAVGMLAWSWYQKHRADARLR